MSRDTLALVRRTLQPPHGQAWHGGPTPVGALRGVTARAAHWTPPGSRQCIWRLTLHIAYWKYTVRRHLEGRKLPRFPRSPAHFPAVPARPDESAWQADKRLLAEEHRLLLAALERLDPALLKRRPAGARRWTREEMVIGVLLHDAYHTGQIQQLKRMWDGRGRQGMRKLK